MTNPVVVDDVVNRWRELSPAETKTAETLIGDAWAELQFRVPGIADRVLSGALSPGLIIPRVVAAVKAAMLNPEGFVQESIDDWSGRRDTSSRSRISFSDDDLAALLEVQAAGARSVRMGW